MENAKHTRIPPKRSKRRVAHQPNARHSTRDRATHRSKRCSDSHGRAKLAGGAVQAGTKPLSGSDEPNCGQRHRNARFDSIHEPRRTLTARTHGEPTQQGKDRENGASSNHSDERSPMLSRGSASQRRQRRNEEADSKTRRRHRKPAVRPPNRRRQSHPSEKGGGNHESTRRR